jgi:metallophosphoesterase superfamily enzyme
MTITVDEEHLEKAVEVKLALQEKSPSRRISWSEHKKVMEEEGVFNSDTSESYRCLVKDYQKITGKLNNLPKHADLIFTSKLDAMKRIVGDFRFEKQINQDILREINKNIREMSRTAVMVDEFRNIILDDIDFSVPHYIYEQPKPSSGTKGILIVTDWHIGVKVDNCLGNYYNLEIAQKRLEELKRITLDKCNTHNISDLYIIGLGDWVEHMYMRDNQSQDCEFGVNMQIAKAGKLLFDLIISLAEYANINFASIGGNHDRANGDKKKNHDGDNANVVISENIKDLIEVLKSNSTKKLRRINMLDVQPDSTEIKLKINNKNFKFLHGDKDRGDMKKRLKAHISMDNEFIDYLIHGHLHHYYCIDDDNGRMVIGVGCLMGKNNYSKDIGATTDASQAFIVVEENGDIIPIRIGLQII